MKANVGGIDRIIRIGAGAVAGRLGCNRHRGLVGLAGCGALGHRPDGLVPTLCHVWLQHLRCQKLSRALCGPQHRRL